MRVSAEYAQTHLNDLLAATERGEEVEIERADSAPVRLSLAEPCPARPESKVRSLVGALKGQIWMADDFKSHASSEEMADLLKAMPTDLKSI